MAAAPKRGGTIRIGKGHGQTTDTMNPGTAENGYMVNLLQSFHGYMTEVAPRWQPGARRGRKLGSGGWRQDLGV